MSNAGKLNKVLDSAIRPSADLAEQLRRAWRSAYALESEAFRAWCAGEGTYEAFIAALDREQCAAQALAKGRPAGQA